MINPEIDEVGNQKWYNEKRELHRLDGPAAIYSDGTQRWYINGELHRIDGPAVIYYNGDKYWYQNGELHREDGPALIYSNGTEIWYQKGQRHRIDGPAIKLDRKEYYYLYGEEYYEKDFLNLPDVITYNKFIKLI